MEFSTNMNIENDKLIPHQVFIYVMIKDGGFPGLDYK